MPRWTLRTTFSLIYLKINVLPLLCSRESQYFWLVRTSMDFTLSLLSSYKSQLWCVVEFGYRWSGCQDKFSLALRHFRGVFIGVRLCQCFSVARSLVVRYRWVSLFCAPIACSRRVLLCTWIVRCWCASAYVHYSSRCWQPLCKSDGSVTSKCWSEYFVEGF